MLSTLRFEWFLPSYSLIVKQRFKLVLPLVFVLRSLWQLHVADAAVSPFRTVVEIHNTTIFGIDELDISLTRCRTRGNSPFVFVNNTQIIQSTTFVPLSTQPAVLIVLHITLQPVVERVRFFNGINSLSEDFLVFVTVQRAFEAFTHSLIKLVVQYFFTVRATRKIVIDACEPSLTVVFELLATVLPVKVLFVVDGFHNSVI